MNVARDGISSPGSNRSALTIPDGHTKLCWASAQGLARRGRPPEDFQISAELARELLATDPMACRCQPGKKRRT